MSRRELLFPLFACVFGLLWLFSSAPAALAGSGSEVCRDEQNFTGHWKVWPGAQESPGTRSVRCKRNEYEEITGSVIQRYDCKEGFANCVPDTVYEVTKTAPNEDGTTTLYWRNKKKPWYKGSMVFYESAQPSRSADTSDAGGAMIDPYGNTTAYPFRSTAERTEFWRPGRAWVTLEHYVNTENDANACIFGKLFATYQLDYRPDFELLYDQESNAILNPIVNGDPKRGIVYDESAWKSLAGKNVVHCYRLVHPRGAGKPVLPRWFREGQLHGVVVSPQTATRYRIEGSKVVDMTPLKACCDEARGICLGMVPWNTGCPRGKSVPGTLGDGQFTNCSVCAKAPVPVADHKPEAAPSVGCCRDGQCKPSPSGARCALSGGTPLEPERACPASGPDPCRAKPPPPEEKLPGACLFKDKPCKEMDSAQACRKSPGYVMFLEGSSCGVKRGGCCDGTNPCFPATLGECLGKGEFFEGGCPAKCPEQTGSCTRRCEVADEMLCQDTTRSECARVDGATFAPGQKCAFQSPTLQCTKSVCSDCSMVEGAWQLEDKSLLAFHKGCRGVLLANPNAAAIPFNYSCKDNGTIDVEYGRQKLELQLFIDGEWRSLQRR